MPTHCGSLMRTAHAAAAPRARSTSPCGGRRRCRSWPARQSRRRRRRAGSPRPPRPSAPSLRSSVAIAAMRSVSLTRQLAMLRSVRRRRRRTARAPRASSPRRECALQSSVDRRRAAAPRARLDPVVAACARRRPSPRSASAKRDVALDRLAGPTPVDAHRAAADRAGREEVRGRRRVAFDRGSSPGDSRSARRPARGTIASRRARPSTPKRAIRFSVIST